MNENELKITETRGKGIDFQRLAIARVFHPVNTENRNDRVVRLTVGFTSLVVPVVELRQMLDELDKAFEQGLGYGPAEEYAREQRAEALFNFTKDKLDGRR